MVHLPIVAPPQKEPEAEETPSVTGLNRITSADLLNTTSDADEDTQTASTTGSEKETSPTPASDDDRIANTTVETVTDSSSDGHTTSL